MTWLIIFSIAASICNAFGDALKFSGVADEIAWADFTWHVVKHCLYIPLWMGTGYFFVTYWNKQRLNDIWHPKRQHWYILLLFIVSVIIWQATYFISRLVLESYY